MLELAAEPAIRLTSVSASRRGGRSREERAGRANLNTA